MVPDNMAEGVQIKVKEPVSQPVNTIIDIKILKSTGERITPWGIQVADSETDSLKSHSLSPTIEEGEQ